MRSHHQRIGGIPYGWDTVKSMDRISKTTRHADDLVPNLVEQRVLAWMVLQSAKGVGPRPMARALNDQSIPSKRGGKWHPSTVQSVLTSARLAEDTTLAQEAA